MLLTRRQKLYLIFMQGIGPFILDGLINAAIAYPMYALEDPELSVWLFPLPYAGDLYMTIVVTCLLTWVGVGVLARRDIRVGNITPIVLHMNERWTTKPKCMRHILWHMRQIPLEWNKTALFVVLKSVVVLILLTSVVFAVPALLICAFVVAGDPDIDEELVWEDLVVGKAVYGGLLGLFVTPISAFLVLCADSLKDNICEQNNTIDNATEQEIHMTEDENAAITEVSEEEDSVSQNIEDQEPDEDEDDEEDNTL